MNVKIMEPFRKIKAFRIRVIVKWFSDSFPSIKTSQSATICFASFNFSMNKLEETVTPT